MNIHKTYIVNTRTAPRHADLIYEANEMMDPTINSG